MTPEEVMQKLGCKRRRLFQLLADGTLERAPRWGREIRIYTESVVRAMTQKQPRKRKQRVTLAPAPVRVEDVPVFE